MLHGKKKSSGGIDQGIQKLAKLNPVLIHLPAKKLKTKSEIIIKTIKDEH